MKKYIQYLTKSESQTFAVWIQTVFLAVGVIYGIQQLSYMSDEQSSREAEKYLEYYRDYRKNEQNKVSQVAIFYQEAARVDDPEKLDKIQLKKIYSYETELIEFLTDVSICNRFGLCSDSAAQLVCSDTVWLHQNLSNAESIEKFNPQRTKRLAWRYERLLNENCSLIHVIAYRMGMNI
ncbi:hypothetical protein [Photobacterium andalusiense]|uniref:Uncharacterized protein n=1 Tax=Photobacterium andalusiense TaxID=2204296 RepID=A0A1Y6MCF5_9GAMM|nr:hypothetical protein [Photobacterium andalusiense]SMY34245.1 hypothetical protein PAND9192_01233 [Photobacterium andalusiense]